MRKLVILFIAVMTLTNLVGQDKQSKKEQKQAKKEVEYQKMLSLIKTADYHFEATNANPQSGQQINLIGNPNFLKVKNDTVNADMPFFGRAYSGLAYGGNGGIEFNTELKEYEVVENTKKKSINISFKAQGKNDQYACMLSVSGSGYATLTITSNNRATISYYGNLTAPPVKKE